MSWIPCGYSQTWFCFLIYRLLVAHESQNTINLKIAHPSNKFISKFQKVTRHHNHIPEFHSTNWTTTAYQFPHIIYNINTKAPCPLSLVASPMQSSQIQGTNMFCKKMWNVLRFDCYWICPTIPNRYYSDDLVQYNKFCFHLGATLLVVISMYLPITNQTPKIIKPVSSKDVLLNGRRLNQWSKCRAISECSIRTFP